MLYVYVTLVTALTVYGQIIIKARSLMHAKNQSTSPFTYLFTMFTDFYVLTGMAAAVFASAFWLLAIERAELSYVYPFMALSFVFVPMASWICFGELISPLQLIGISLIVLGVCMHTIAR